MREDFADARVWPCFHFFIAAISSLSAAAWATACFASPSRAFSLASADFTFFSSDVFSSLHDCRMAAKRSRSCRMPCTSACARSFSAMARSAWAVAPRAASLDACWPSTASSFSFRSTSSCAITRASSALNRSSVSRSMSSSPPSRDTAVAASRRALSETLSASITFFSSSHAHCFVAYFSTSCHSVESSSSSCCFSCSVLFCSTHSFSYASMT